MKRVLIWLWVLAVFVAVLWALPSKGEPVLFTVETGIMHAKWGSETYPSGAPLFHDPKWYVDADFSWRPPLLRLAGVALVAGFRYQALSSEIPGALGFRYVDGPKIALRGSWELQ